MISVSICRYLVPGTWWSKVKWKWLSRVQLFATPWTIESVEFSRPEYWSGQPFPSPGDLPNPGIKSRSPALQADSLPAKSQGKPKNIGVGSLSLLQQIFPTHGSYSINVSTQFLLFSFCQQWLLILAVYFL